MIVAAMVRVKWQMNVFNTRPPFCIFVLRAINSESCSLRVQRSRVACAQVRKSDLPEQLISRGYLCVIPGTTKPSPFFPRTALERSC